MSPCGRRRGRGEGAGAHRAVGRQGPPRHQEPPPETLLREGTHPLWEPHPQHAAPRRGSSFWWEQCELSQPSPQPRGKQVPRQRGWTQSGAGAGCCGFRLPSGQPVTPTPGPHQAAPGARVPLLGPLLSPRQELLQLDLGQDCEQVRAEPLSESTSRSPRWTGTRADTEECVKATVLLPRLPSISPASLLGSGEIGVNETKILPPSTS